MEIKIRGCAVDPDNRKGEEVLHASADFIGVYRWISVVDCGFWHQRRKQMKRKYLGAIGILATAGSLFLAGCGSGGGNGSSTAGLQATPTVSGVAATGAPILGNAFLKDSSNPAKEMTTVIKSDGSFSFNVTGFTPPFILKAAWQTGSVNNQLISFASAAGTANIHPLSNVEVANAAGVVDPSTLYATVNATMLQTIAANMTAAEAALEVKLKPLLDLYGVTIDPITGPFVANHTGFDAMLDAITIQINAGNVVMMNKQTGTTIFSAPMSNIAGGTFTAGNMPAMTPTPTPTPTPIDGVALYGTYCASCHGSLASSSKKGATSAQIQAGISANMGGMGSLSSLTTAQIDAIAAAIK